MSKRFACALATWLMTTFSSELFACAVCGAGETDPTRNAYTGSTAFLSFIPLIAIGAVIFTVYRYVKKGEESPHEPQ